MATESRDEPGKLFDFLIAKLALKNDAALSRAMDITPPVISNCRAGRLNIGPAIILRIHEKTGIPVSELRAQIAA